MTMERAAQLFDELDATTSTNAKVEALARYFSEAQEEDRLWVMALLSGRRPRRPVTSGQLRQWVAELSGIPDWLLEHSYHVVGDLAETITLLAPTGPRIHRSLTAWVAFVEDLRHRTDEEKARLVKSAWQGLDRTACFVFNKIITGGFRIGVSQKIMVKGLARATGLHEDVIAHRLMGDWSPHTTTFQELLFSEHSGDEGSRPYPFYLAYPLEEPDGRKGLEALKMLGDPAEWQAEYKWDGIRGQLIARGGRHYVWSRGEELVTDKYPEFQGLLTTLPSGTVLDGEIMGWRQGAPLSFHQLQQRIGRKTVGRKLLEDVPVVFMAYDLLEHQGMDMREQPLQARRRILEQLVPAADHPALRLSHAVGFSGWDELVEHRQKARDNCAEGLMLKRLESTYEVGRRKGDWWKWKVDALTLDAVLTFSMRGHGRRADLYTDHTFGLWHNGDLVTFAKAYSGLTDLEMKQVDAFVKKNTIGRFGPVRQVKPELVFELAFEGISASSRHKSGVAVRFPRIARWRHDKPAAEANTLEDLHTLMGQRG
jgi:DNA ligase 1